MCISYECPKSDVIQLHSLGWLKLIRVVHYGKLEWMFVIRGLRMRGAQMVKVLIFSHSQVTMIVSGQHLGL